MALTGVRQLLLARLRTDPGFHFGTQPSVKGTYRRAKPLQVTGLRQPREDEGERKPERKADQGDTVERDIYSAEPFT